MSGLLFYVPAQKTDTLWIFRFNTSTEGWQNAPHGTFSKLSLNSDPRHARSGKSLRIDWCIGQTCQHNEDWEYASFMVFGDWNFTGYNTMGVWVQSNGQDTVVRDFQPGWNYGNWRIWDGPMVVNSRDTVGHFMTLPLVRFFQPKWVTDRASQMAACCPFEFRQGIGSNPVKAGSGTYWVDDFCIFYDPANPAFPGPPVSTVQPILSGRSGAAGTARRAQSLLPLAGAKHAPPWARLYELTGRLSDETDEKGTGLRIAVPVSAGSGSEAERH